MSDYFVPTRSSSRGSECSNGFVNGLYRWHARNDETDDESPPPTVDDSTILRSPQTWSSVNENNLETSSTWNISLTDDQDEVSERSLGIHNNESITVAEQFGPAILSIPKYIREEADKLLKPSEINVNEIYNFGNTKASWILPTSYQQYLKFIPPNVLAKNERHVIYPWTQWNTLTDEKNRPSSSISSSTSSNSNNNNSSSSSTSNNYNNNSSSSSSSSSSSITSSTSSSNNNDDSNDICSSCDAMAADTSWSSVSDTSFSYSEPVTRQWNPLQQQQQQQGRTSSSAAPSSQRRSNDHNQQLQTIWTINGSRTFLIIGHRFVQQQQQQQQNQ